MSGSSVGFVGLGIMGEPMARNLHKSSKFSKVVVWNQNKDKCSALLSEGCLAGDSPADVVRQCDVTFGMVSDPAAALEVATGPDGIADGMSEGKGYVDMSTVDAGTSSAISAAIEAKGGKFLEAPVSGTKKPAVDGTLIILAAGARELYDSAVPAFECMGKKSYYLGAVGAGAKMKLVVNMIMGSMMGAFSEGLALAQESGLDPTELLDVLSIGALNNPMFSIKGPSMLQHSYPTAFPLKHQAKDMRLALALGDELDQGMPVAAAANELFKKARQMGLADADMSALFEAVRRQEG